MKTYKPDLNEKVTIRISPALKRKMAELCERHDFDEALVVRTALEAGIQLAREQGIAKMIEKRGVVFAGRATQRSSDPKNSPKAKYFITKGSGSGWMLSDSKGKLISKGPLYDMKRKAKKLAPLEFISLGK